MAASAAPARQGTAQPRLLLADAFLIGVIVLFARIPIAFGFLL